MTIQSQSQRCLEAECVAKWDRYQKTPRRQYRNQGQILTNERQTQSTPDIKNIAESFRTRVFAPRNDCRWRRLWNIESGRWKVYLLHEWKWYPECDQGVQNSTYGREHSLSTVTEQSTGGKQHCKLRSSCHDSYGYDLRSEPILQQHLGCQSKCAFLWQRKTVKDERTESEGTE